MIKAVRKAVARIWEVLVAHALIIVSFPDSGVWDPPGTRLTDHAF